MLSSIDPSKVDDKAARDFNRIGFPLSSVQSFVRHLFVSAKWHRHLNQSRLYIREACTFSRGRMCAPAGLTFLSSSDDGAEEAEAADRPIGTPSAHERQPPAACVKTPGTLETSLHRLAVWTRACAPHARVALHVCSTECESNLKKKR